jgi:hypothetical protein
MMPPVHSEVFSSIVDMLPGGAFSGYLPYCCLLLVAAIVLVSCCASCITVGSVGTSCWAAYCDLSLFQFKIHSCGAVGLGTRGCRVSLS